MAKVHQINKMAQAISAGVILGFFNGKDAEKVAEQVGKVEHSRLSYLYGFFPQSSVADVRNAVSEALKQTATDVGGKDTPAYRSKSNRMRDVQVLYGAWAFGGLKEPKGGYHDTVAAARDTLKASGLKWTGDKVPEKWERDIRAEVGREAEIALAVKMAEKTAENKGETFGQKEADAVSAETRNKMERAGAVAMAAGLLKKHGPDYCGHLIDALEGAIAAQQQEVKDSKAAKQATG